MDYATQLMNKWLDRTYKVTQRPGTAAASTRRYYKVHQGWDFATPANTPLTSKTKGKVVYAGYDKSGWGNRVGIYEPSTGKTTYLSHLSQIAVKPGQEVDVGTFLGRTGGIPGTYGAGNTTGAHVDITEYMGNKVFPSYGIGTKNTATNMASNIPARVGINADMVASAIKKARSKFGNKVIAVGTPQGLSRLGIKGKIVKL